MCIEADRAFQDYKKTGRARLLPHNDNFSSLVDAYVASSGLVVSARAASAHIKAS